MSDMGSYSYVYVVLDNDGEPVLVVQTEVEAKRFISEDSERFNYQYFEAPYKHHN